MEAAKQGPSLPVVRLEDKDGSSDRLAWSRAQLLVISTVCSLLILATMGVIWRTKGEEAGPVVGRKKMDQMFYWMISRYGT